MGTWVVNCGQGNGRLVCKVGLVSARMRAGMARVVFFLLSGNYGYGSLYCLPIPRYLPEVPTLGT